MKKMSQQEEDLVSDAIKEFEQLSNSRSNYDNHCAEIAERIVPAHKNLFRQRGYSPTKGEKRTDFLLDSTAATALTRFGSILDSLLTPRTSIWHKLMASNPLLNRDRQVRLWFEEVNQYLFKKRYDTRANFASQNQSNYRSLGAYGTGCVFIDKLAGNDPGLRYRNIHLSEIWFAENHQGLVDKAYRYFPMTARQAKQRWKEVPEKIEQATDPEKEFFFLHCVKPRADRDMERVDYKGFEYASYYIAFDDKFLMEEGGFTSFPFAISRYEQCPGEVYGRSPAMDVLPAVKTLNEQKRTMLRQGQRAADPVYITHDDGVLDGFSMRSNAINSGGVTADGRPLIHALPTGNFQIAKEMMDDERTLINDSFLISLFQILTETPAMTATEVIERTKEKGFLLAPTIGRQQSEYLGPMIERELDVLNQMKILPPIPMALKEAAGEYRIEYESPLSRTQRAEEAAGLMRTLETAIQVINVTQDPSILDFLDADTAMPEVAAIQGMPLRWTKSMEAIQQIRQKRAQQQQQQQVVNAAPGAAALTKAATIATQGK